MGASIISAKEKAIPYDARLNLGSANRAISAERYGPSMDIINHVAANGIQNANIDF